MQSGPIKTVIVEPKNDDGFTEATRGISAMGDGVAERLSKEEARVADHIAGYAEDQEAAENENVKDDANEDLHKEEKKIDKVDAKIHKEEAEDNDKVETATITSEEPVDKVLGPDIENQHHEAVLQLEELLEHARRLTKGVTPSSALP